MLRWEDGSEQPPLIDERCTFMVGMERCETTERLVLIDEPGGGWRTLCEQHMAEIMARRQERLLPWG